MCASPLDWPLGLNCDGSHLGNEGTLSRLYRNTRRGPILYGARAQRGVHRHTQ